MTSKSVWFHTLYCMYQFSVWEDGLINTSTTTNVGFAHTWSPNYQ